MTIYVRMTGEATATVNQRRPEYTLCIMTLQEAFPTEVQLGGYYAPIRGADAQCRRNLFCFRTTTRRRAQLAGVGGDGSLEERQTRGANPHCLTSLLTSYILSIAEGRLLLATWQVQDAKARFSELLEITLKKGPQIVTRRGVEAAVLVPIDEWHRLQRSARPNLKTLLLGEGPLFEDLIPDRQGFRRRKPVNLK